MEVIKKHIDTVVILGAIVSSMLWMNGKFNDVERDFSAIRTEIAVIKAVMIMKQILPPELAKGDN